MEFSSSMQGDRLHRKQKKKEKACTAARPTFHHDIFLNNNNNNNNNNNHNNHSHNHNHNRSLFHKINIHIPCYKIVDVQIKLRYMKWQLKSILYLVFLKDRGYQCYARCTYASYIYPKNAGSLLVQLQPLHNRKPV